MNSNNNYQQNGSHGQKNSSRDFQRRTPREYLQIAYRYRWLILASLVVVLSIIMYNTYTMHPIYSASTTIEIQSSNSQLDNLFNMPGVSQQSFEINTQIEHLKSRTLAENVIETLQHSPYADQLFVLGTRQYNAKDLSSLINNLLSKIKSYGRDIIPKGNTEKPAPTELAHSLNGVSERVNSRAMVNRLQSWMFVRQIEETRLVEITIEAPDPREAVLLANTIVQEYQKIDLANSRSQVQQEKTFLQNQLTSVRDNLQHAENELMRYQEHSDVVTLDKDTQTLVNNAANIESQYNSAVAERSALESRLNFLQSQLSESEKRMVDNTSNALSPYIKALRDSLAAKQVQLTVLQNETNMSSNHPAIQQLQNNIDKLKTRLEQETEKYVQSGMEMEDPVAHSQDVMTQIFNLQAQLISVRTRENQLKQMTQSYNAKVEQLPQKSLQLARLQREKQVNENLYLLLKNKFEEARISEAGQVGSVVTVDAAEIPTAPIRPNKKRNLLLGLMLGLSLGIGLSLALDYMDNSVRNDQDIINLSLNPLIAIPVIERKFGHKKKYHTNKANGIRKVESRIITEYATNDPVFESYRHLRTKLQYLNPDKPRKSILITSPDIGEGKTITALNLSLELAQGKNKILLIDGDMRKSMLHRVLDLKKSPGLSDVLVGKCEMEMAIQPTDRENLYLLASGPSPPNPAELLDSAHLEQLLSLLSQQFDLIIIDSPPINVVTDAVVLSAHSDTTIVVAAFGETKKDALEHAAFEISEVGGSILGVLLNKKKVDRFYKSHYTYKYYYGTKGKSKSPRSEYPHLN